MKVYSGSCQCKSVNFTLSLAKPLASYSARKCDCDFCIERNIHYLSEPGGQLNIQSDSALIKQKQGSEQAVFLTCGQCQDVLAATVEVDNKRLGAANVSLLHQASRLMPATVVSPKKLSPEDKLSRWLSIWLTVVINDQSARQNN